MSSPSRRESHAFPPAFVERLRQLVPDEAGEVLASFAAPRVVALRVNTLRAGPADVLQALRDEGLVPRPVPWCPQAAVLPPGSLRALQASGPHERGEVYVQGLASLTAPLVLAPRPGHQVLDLCAAPGSKTTQLGALLGGGETLVANDRSRQRCFRLRAVLAAQGLDEVVVTCRPGESYGKSHPGAFDRVLVDAPCSAEGRFRSDDPSTWRGWHIHRVKRLAGRQERLLRAAVAATREGGEVVYATCTLAPEENEAVVDRVLAAYEGALRLLPIDRELPRHRPGVTEWGKRRFDSSLSRTVRIVPDETVEGFFLARLGKGQGPALRPQEQRPLPRST